MTSRKDSAAFFPYSFLHRGQPLQQIDGQYMPYIVIGSITGLTAGYTPMYR